jgi:hypothetical protein
MPRTSQDEEPVFFAAPAGTRVRVLTGFSFAVIAGFVVFNVFLAREMHAPPRQFWPMVLAPTIGLAVVIPVVLHAWVRGYRLASGELQVVRLGRINRFAPAALTGARKSWGNDGAGAITGNFRSEALGKFEVIATHPGHTVVLTWPDHSLVVTPEQPEKFAEAVRLRAGLHR